MGTCAAKTPKGKTTKDGGENFVTLQAVTHREPKKTEGQSNRKAPEADDWEVLKSIRIGVI